MVTVESNPKIMKGKPVISGTRITVESIIERLSYGESREQILEAHPQINDEAINAALSFAVQALKADVIYPVAS
ncbi:DUF433 domain-containing protein [Marivirga tractuosa]|uniref:DUF433 domain-containing protein n=1 Tax=Marivirga tractuosa TaxID=1006 RepID=UPI0035CF9B86